MLGPVLPLSFLRRPEQALRVSHELCLRPSAPLLLPILLRPSARPPSAEIYSALKLFSPPAMAAVVRQPRLSLHLGTKVIPSSLPRYPFSLSRT